jgi:dipeptidyl aminopeptidase/acylaminoacyl peptidase
VEVPGFEVVRRIGSGGMGEVFHAVRVGPGGFRKPVALKRLQLDHSINARMVQRFYAEARISAQLEHPNLVRVHDLLVVDDGYFIVMELLRGRTVAQLRDELDEVPWWLPLAIGEQALAGLEHAHALADEDGRPLGLVHRDLTPRNLFVCDGGVVKILDFGIAKLRHALTPGPTAGGAPMGTLEFLAPEQARGEAADARTDLYQLGGALYWLASGAGPHGSGTAAELVARAIAGTVTPLADRRLAAIEGALAAAPEDRYPDATTMRAAFRAALRDVAAGPEAIAALLPGAPEPARSSSAGDVAAPTELERTPPAPRRRRRAWVLVACAVVAAIAIAVVVLRRDRGGPRAGGPAEYQRVTFGRGSLYSARFAPDGASFVYSAAWGEGGTQLFLGEPEQPDARSLDLPGAEVVALSADGTLALIRDVRLYGFSRRGTLARVPLAGGAPRDLAEDVERADFAPDGELAVVRWVDGRPRLEYPLGEVLYEASATGWIGDARVSPRGDAVAFVEHSMLGDDRGRIALVDTSGRVTALTADYSSVQGLAWSRRSGEILFAAAEGGPRALRAVSRSGRIRLLDRAPGQLTLLDAAPDGSLLVRQDVEELRTIGGEVDGAERDLSWLNFSFPTSISDDGEWLVLYESGSEVGAGPGLYRRRLDGSDAAVRIAEGSGGLSSPDGRWVLAGGAAGDRLTMVPTGAGEPRQLVGSELGVFVTGDWSRDGRRLLVWAARAGEPVRAYVLDLDGGPPRAVPRQGIRFTLRGHVLAPDNRRAVVIDETTGALAIVDLETGALPAVAGARPGEEYASWSADGASLYVATMSTAPLRVDRLDPVTGARARWRELMPEDAVGVQQITQLELTPDARAYAYAYHRVLSTLYLVEGL